MKKLDEAITKYQKPLRFLVAGVLSNSTNYFVYLSSLLTGDYKFAAAFFGYLAGLLVSYLINRFWVFKIPANLEYALSAQSQTILFITMHVVSAILFGSLISIFGASFGFGPSFSWFLSILPIATLNYIFLECVVFRKKGKRLGKVNLGCK